LVSVPKVVQNCKPFLQFFRKNLYAFSSGYGEKKGGRAGNQGENEPENAFFLCKKGSRPCILGLSLLEYLYGILEISVDCDRKRGGRI